VPLSREFPAVAASLASIRQAVAACARAAGASPGLTADVVLAVHEAAANAVVHAYGGGAAESVIAIEGTKGAGWLRFIVGDRGRGFRPRRSNPGYGLGLAIIAGLADELEIRDGETGGVSVRIAFRL
jgi:anti-sigma regulatory factor (Ser/Thr protein kinase)